MSGGLLKIMEEIKVKNVVICQQGKNSENYEKYKKIINEKNIKNIVVKKGDEILVEKNLKIKILWPMEKQIQENILNNNSIVLKINYKNFSCLFTGDIEKIAEEQILNEYEGIEILKSTILKVGHHGSKTSTTQKFLEAVSPKIALIGVGKNNTFGHPNEEVIERLENMRKRYLSNRPSWRDKYNCISKWKN